jgi:hypothetical protein
MGIGEAKSRGKSIEGVASFANALICWSVGREIMQQRNAVFFTFQRI